MSSFSVPFYGKINRMSVDPSDNTLCVVASHPNGRSIAPVRIDVASLLDGGSVNDVTTSIEIEGVTTDVLGHSTGLYFSTIEGKIYRADGASAEMFDCGRDFGLQAIVAFQDGAAEFPAMKAGGSVALRGGQNRKLLLVGKASALVIDVQENGVFSTSKQFSFSGQQGKITAWAANSVFSREKQTHHCAFGWDNGAVTAFYTDADDNQFNAIQLMHANEVEINSRNPLHEGAITGLLYVQETDVKGNTKRYLMSTGIDMKLFQISLLEGIAIQRKNQHEGRINALVSGAFADGDGSRRGPKFGRFYTLSSDSTVKAWLNEFTNELVSSYPAERKMCVGTCMVLNVPHTSGIYAKGPNLGQAFPTPHLVLTDGAEIRFLPLVHCEKSDVRLLDDLRDNGRMAETASLLLTGGASYVQEMGIDHSSAKVRQQSLAIFKSWDAEWLMDMLNEIASNDSYPIAYRENAINALKSSAHPRRIVLLEEMLNDWNGSNVTQQLAYESLKQIFPSSLRPQQLVLENGGEENKLRVIGDLATFARGSSPLKRESLQMLQGLLRNAEYTLALRAYDNICGEGELAAVTPGVEGVLYAIYSNDDDIRKEMAVRLANRGLMAAFETTLILRRLLEDSDEVVRERAVAVSLLRASQVADVLRFSDTALHERLYVLVHGSFASTDDREALLKAALPTEAQVSSLLKAFRGEDSSVQEDLDVLLEFSSCSKDDVTVYALQARASFGFKAAAQGLLKLSNSGNQKVMRQAMVGLGYMVELDDAHQRICGVTLSKSTPFEIGCVSIYHAIKGYELRNENPVENVLRKVLDGGHPKLRETAVVIAQSRLNAILPSLQSRSLVETKEKEVNVTSITLSAEQAKEIAQIEKEIRDATDMLELGKTNKSTQIMDIALETLKELNDRKAALSGKPTQDKPVETIEQDDEYSSLKSLLKVALAEETLHANVRAEIYKSFWMHNLEDEAHSSDKTATFKLFLNLRDGTLFNRALKDLCSHMQDVADRSWALDLFKQMINLDIVPEHHSNVWTIWTTIANFAETEIFEQEILRIGFECSAPCHCRINRDGSFSVCTRHRIRRDAFLRVLSASGDWLAEFIREALTNAGNRNSSAGESAAVLAVSDRAKQAVARMDKPSEFILSMLKGDNPAQKAFACELLLMYPRYYSTELKNALYEMRKEPEISALICDRHAVHLMTEALFEHFFAAVLDGHTEYLSVGLERFAMEHGRAEAFAKALYEHDDLRLIRKGMSIAETQYDTWGEALLHQALDADDQRAKVAFSLMVSRLERAALKINNDASLNTFVTEFYEKSSTLRRLWVLESLKLSATSAQWKLDLLRGMCSSKADEIRERGFTELNALQRDASLNEAWMVSLLKKGLMDSNSRISELCFQGLLWMNKALGPTQEKEFLSKIARENKKHREQAVALALTTTASWRVAFILEALNDEDSMIRSLMCQKVRSISGLNDAFFQDLQEHPHDEVRSMATDVLAARGLYRPKSSISGDLKTRILKDPPRRPETDDFKIHREEGQYDIDWSRYSSARLIWYWKVQDWKKQKIEAIISAGKTHNTEYYQVFRDVLTRFGYRSKISDLWAHAMYATSWGYENWWEFIVLHTGWVLKDKTQIAYAQSEADGQRSDRLRVAWHVAAMRSGQKSNLEWLIKQYYDNGWNNRSKQYIKREYLFEGLFAVDSFVGFESKSEGPAFTIMQRLMTDDRGFVNDIFRLNMLRLSEQGGPVDFIAIGYTSSDNATVLESVQMRERQYSKEELLKGVISFLNDAQIPSKDPYALSNVGGAWYDVVRLTLELHMQSFDGHSEVAIGYWRNIASMLSCRHPQLRARAVNAYFRRHVYGEEKERFIADVENFSRQLVHTTVDSFPLLQDDTLIKADASRDLAYDAYMGLIRKTAYPLEYRKDALTYVAEMCEKASDTGRALPILKTALVMNEEQIRFQAYRMLIALQDKDNGLLSLHQLVQMGLRSTDSRLKKMAISLIWCTNQLPKSEKVTQLESILKNVNDVASRYAFDLLYAFAGRPSAWDKADSDKDLAYQEAKATKERNCVALEEKITSVRNSFEEYKTATEAQISEVDSQTRVQLEEGIASRRREMNAEVQTLRDTIRQQEEQYRVNIENAEQAHSAAMVAPLSTNDLQTWADANARRDAVLAMGIDAYYPELRLHAVDSALTELARRRPYFKNGAEEFTGYFVRLQGVVETALTSSYSDLQRHTALSMAEYKFSLGYKVLLDLLASHDSTDQSDAITALVQLGPIALTEYKDSDGNPLPRTALILLDRAVKDEFGTVERYQIFNAIGQLKDRDSSVQERLFVYLNEGVDSSDYTSVLDALIEMTGCKSQVLKGVQWADLTANDYAELQPCLSHELDWAKVDFAKFQTLYQDVFDEGLLAKIMNNLIDRGDFNGLTRWPNLISLAEQTKGFDVVVEAGEIQSEPINRVLRRLAVLPNKSETSNVRQSAINALMNRLTNIGHQRTEAQATRLSIANSLVEVLEANKAVIDDQVLDIAICLGTEKLGALSKVIFDVLYTVVTSHTEYVHRRVKAMNALGYLGDERSVLALLNAAGFDAYGEELLVETEEALSESDRDTLQNAAAEALGGMIFAQEREGIFQLLSQMSRSRDNTTRCKGFEGMRYFFRSEEHAMSVAAIFAERYQGALNSYRSDFGFFLRLLSQAMTPVSHETHADNASMVVTANTEALLREYVLKTFFGEVFEMEGEAFNPLSVDRSIFDADYDDESNLEMTYQVIRQWVHGPHQEPLLTDEDGNTIEVPIDFSYLAEKSPEERTRALKAERKIFENGVVNTKYTKDITQVLASYLSATELLEMVEEAFRNDFETNEETTERYNILLNALLSAKPSPIVEALKCLKEEYTLTIQETLPDTFHHPIVVSMFEHNLEALSEHMDSFVELVQWLYEQLQVMVAKRQFGDVKFSEQRANYFEIVEDLILIARDLPTRSELVRVLEGLLDVCAFIENEEYPQDVYAQFFEAYLEYGQIDWNIVDRHLVSAPRSLRNVLVSYLTVENASEVLPRVMSWIEDDAAALTRLVDVLRSMHTELQEQVVALLKESGSSRSVILVLSRLQNVDAFKLVVDSFRDEDGKISSEKGVRSILTPRSTEKETSPLLVEALFNGLAMMATDKAEYYLRDLAEDTSLSYDVRNAANKAAKVAYRRRVPLHIRRAERS